jgi:CBS domain-containing protein
MDELQQFLDAELQKPINKLLYVMGKNALQYEPPLTFFKNIRTQTVNNQEVFDIKTAMTPIVDLVRVYALKERLFKLNTGERLKALMEKSIFTETAYQELMQSYYFLMSLRLKSQANQIIQDKKAPDNYIDLRQVTKIEQVTLIEIFKTIENFQSRIKFEFMNSLF